MPEVLLRAELLEFASASIAMIALPSDAFIGAMEHRDKARARIVQRINSYDELVAALELAAANLRICWHPDTWERDPTAIQIRAAIAKAGGAS